MNKNLINAALKWGVFLALAFSATDALAADPGDFSPMMSGNHDVRFEFKRPELAGFETDRLRNRLQSIQVRGWHVAHSAWFGQTRIAHHSGVGLVVQNGNTVYQLNNRGLQITKYF